jgi:hypothetical protein
MGGSGKWVKSLIGLKKPEKEDGKVRGIGCCWFPVSENVSFHPCRDFLSF